MSGPEELPAAVVQLLAATPAEDRIRSLRTRG